MSNPKAPTTKTLLIVTLSAVAIVGSLAAYVKFAPADRVPDDQRRPAVSNIKPPAPNVDVSVRNRTQVLVFTPVYEGTSLRFTSITRPVPDNTKPEVFAVQAFLNMSKVTDADVRVLDVDVRNGLATISLNGAFAAGYGTDDESVLLAGISRALGQFPAIEKVEFYVDGVKLDTLGHIELVEPLPVIRSTTTDEEPKSPEPS